MLKKQSKKKIGRPNMKFDLNQVKVFGLYGGSYSDMANFFNCSMKTIERNMGGDNEFSRAYKNGRIETKLAIASKQRAVALAGNPTMLIWLGKQYLGQHEPDVSISVEKLDLKEFSNVIRNNYTPENQQ